MQVFGHRGSPGFPRHHENTLESFEQALTEGADGIEFDIRRCADGQLVVIHDETVDRTTRGRGRVDALPYSQLSQLEVPLLTDVLDGFGKRTELHIEVKEPGLTQEVSKLVIGRSLRATVVLSGFDPFWRELAGVASTIPIALLSTVHDAQYIPSAVQLGANAIHVAKEAVTPEMVREAHAAKLTVRAFTVNSDQDIRRLKSMSVDGIFSDFPGRARQVLVNDKG